MKQGGENLRSTGPKDQLVRFHTQVLRHLFSEIENARVAIEVHRLQGLRGRFNNSGKRAHEVLVGRQFVRLLSSHGSSRLAGNIRGGVSDR